jgi:hypothetical protein
MFVSVKLIGESFRFIRGFGGVLVGRSKCRGDGAADTRFGVKVVNVVVLLSFTLYFRTKCIKCMFWLALIKVVDIIILELMI